MKRCNVIAGTYEQAHRWCRQNQMHYPDDKLVPINEPIQLKGHVNPKGILVGSWLHNPKIQEILTLLVCQTFDPNPGLDKAIQLYNKHKKL